MSHSFYIQLPPTLLHLINSCKAQFQYFAIFCSPIISVWSAVVSATLEERSLDIQMLLINLNVENQ